MITEQEFLEKVNKITITQFTNWLEKENNADFFIKFNNNKEEKREPSEQLSESILYSYWLITIKNTK